MYAASTDMEVEGVGGGLGLNEGAKYVREIHKMPASHQVSFGPYVRSSTYEEVPYTISF